MTIYTIYGRPKVGKTTLSLADAPKGKTALLNADKGLRGIDITGIDVFEDMSIAALTALTSDPSFTSKYRRVVIDTATSLYDTMLTELCGPVPTWKMYKPATAHFMSILRPLMSDKIQVIVLCQERIKHPDESWTSEDADESTLPQASPDLPGSASSGLYTLTDMIGRLYMASLNGRQVRRLWLAPVDTIIAGARSTVYKSRPPYLKNPSITRLDDMLGWTH